MPAPDTTDWTWVIHEPCPDCGFDPRPVEHEDDPVVANWDQDETALAQRYWTQQPGEVGSQLRRNADLIAAAFAAVDGTQWQRPGRRDNGSVFTVDTFARYFLHDLAHHAWDVSGRPAG